MNGKYINPDELISISSDIKMLTQLKSEVCRIPKKPNGNGFIQIMTKEEMRRLKIMSPNMADSLMMSLVNNWTPVVHYSDQDVNPEPENSY